MSRLPAMPDASFRTKVLVPVFVVMVLIVTISMWLANQQIKEQIQKNASQRLKSAGAMLKITQQNREKDLLRCYSDAKNEPRFKAATKMFEPGQTELDPEQQNTFVGILDDLIKEDVADVIVLTPGQGVPVPVARDPQINLQAFEASSSTSIKSAFAGESIVDTIENNNRLFDIVAIPISVGDTNAIVGVITFGVENSMAQQFARLSQDDDLVLLADDHVVATTLRNDDLVKLLPARFAQMTSRNQAEEGIANEQFTLNDEHFLCTAGWLGGKNDEHRLGYLILSSYEKPLQALQSTRQIILIISLLAILSGGVTVWLLVSKVTRPLSELRDSAEAVGRGDFTRRVPVRGRDECGELATVFNQMTENIKQSRAQIEQTIETLKSTQAQLIQSEKLSAVGEFVAGVAHELNNPLAAVVGFSEMLKDNDVDTRNRRYLDMIYKSAQRCQKIVQSLLSFARRHQHERKPVSLNGMVEAVLEMLNYQLRTSNIEVVTKLDPSLPVVLADAHQFQQVLLNVINNARQAIENHQSEGQIKIVTETAGDHVHIIVRDNGPGIPAENLLRIFDPFFTTKQAGQGTGLGLSLCYGIIKEHGGNITPSSPPGEGATFTIKLPILHLAGDTLEAGHAAKPKTLDANEGAGKKILVIDDEEAILQMLQERLIQSGYGVDTASDGENALRQLRQKDYDVTFCDWKMPGLNGRQIYEKLRAASPDRCRRIVFFSGDVVNEQMRGFLKQEKRLCLAKPFAFDEIHAAIKTILTAAG
jgi:signal transduction histidine kinase/ActR/RegA family two-component response regulator